VSPVKYELGCYIPEDDILHSHCCENLKSYVISCVCKLLRAGTLGSTGDALKAV
jgi:hypothetical protein